MENKNTMQVVSVCHQCQKVFRFVVKVQGWLDWKAGKLIQNALPDLSEDLRELLITDTCGECFDKMFAGNEDDEESEIA